MQLFLACLCEVVDFKARTKCTVVPKKGTSERGLRGSTWTMLCGNNLNRSWPEACVGNQVYSWKG